METVTVEGKEQKCLVSARAKHTRPTLLDFQENKKISTEIPTNFPSLGKKREKKTKKNQEKEDEWMRDQ